MVPIVNSPHCGSRVGLRPAVLGQVFDIERLSSDTFTVVGAIMAVGDLRGRPPERRLSGWRR